MCVHTSHMREIHERSPTPAAKHDVPTMSMTPKFLGLFCNRALKIEIVRRKIGNSRSLVVDQLQFVGRMAHNL